MELIQSVFSGSRRALRVRYPISENPDATKRERVRRVEDSQIALPLVAEIEVDNVSVYFGFFLLPA